MEPNKSVIDMGCGAKNILKFYKPSQYLGVDGIKQADLVLDLNSDFQIEGQFDYVVNSGILEFVQRPDLYLEKIKGLGKVYFISWWKGYGWGRMHFNEVEKMISKNYSITEEIKFGTTNKLYVCI
jgi:hypothetical protein